MLRLMCCGVEVLLYSLLFLCSWLRMASGDGEWRWQYPSDTTFCIFGAVDLGNAVPKLGAGFSASVAVWQ